MRAQCGGYRYPYKVDMLGLPTNFRVIASQCAHWRGNPFSLSLYERHAPKGHLCALRHTQTFGLQGLRIATPACALVRNDTEWGQQS